MKRVCGSQQVGESPSSSQHSTVRRNILKSESGRICLFVEGDQHRNKNPYQFVAIASKNNTTEIQRLPQYLNL